MRTRSALLLSAALLLGMPQAHADITLNLKDADISTLIATVSEVTGKNFVVDNRVKGKVTVISAVPMDDASLYETFLAVLSVNGFAAIQAGEVIKIIPEAGARQEGGELINDPSHLPHDDVVTHVYRLRNINAQQLLALLRPMVPQWGHLAAYTANNTLIIADRASNVERIGRMIEQMDAAGDRDIELIPLKYASAAEVVRILTSMVQQGAGKGDGGASQATVIADERSNSILIGGDKSERQKYVDVIAKLDVQLQEDGGATQVIYLKYASAENLAPILEGYAKQLDQQPAANATSGDSAAPAGNAPAPAPAARSVSASGGSSLYERTRVLAEPETNALIVSAPPKTMRQLRDVIAQLDIRRSQVLIEAIIAEVSENKSHQLGVDWAVLNDERIAAASILDPTTLSGIAAAATTGNAAAAASAIGQGINIGGGAINDNGTSFAILLKALRGDGDSNVLSTPTLVTMDNEEAKFSVGQEVPFLTGSFSNTGTTTGAGIVNPFQTINRRDVGLTLSVTPQINEGNSVKLNLDLEISSLASGATSAVDLITNKRTLTNAVSVENGQILVIAGLLGDDLQDQQSGVPLLSKIPLLGNLFKFRKATRSKQNLMLFVRPSILRTADDGDYYTQRKYDYIRQRQLDASGAVRVLGGDSPLLIPFEPSRNPSAAPQSAPAATPESAPASTP